MAIKDRIKQARLKKGYTQEQLAQIIGVAKSTLAGYELGSREPSIITIVKIMEATGVDANYLWQDECNFHIQVSYIEMEYIKKYRDLDDHGREMVDFILEKEYERSKELKNKFKQQEIVSSNESIQLDPEFEEELRTGSEFSIQEIDKMA